MSAFPGIRVEGGLLGPDTPDQILAGELPGQRPSDFGLDGRRTLTDEIASVFADARAQWEVFKRRLERLLEGDPGTSVTRDAWMIPFLSLLGYEVRYNPRAYQVDSATFAISHRAGEAEDAPPVHIVGARQELGRVAPSGRPRLAPHSLLQEFLNRSEHLWGIVTNGLTLRLLRDSTYIRRQAYVEFDLRQIFEEQRFNDFAVLYRLLHRTRLPRTAADARDCLLEQYHQHALEQGGRVREHLRDGVEECIKRLANGFLAHPDNGGLRTRLASSEQRAASGQEEQPLDTRHSPLVISPLAPEEFYRQLLRLVYRFLFLLVSEDRGLISADPLYREHYGIARLRRLLDRRSAYTEHDDLWCSLRVLWKVLSDEKLARLLGAAPLNGELFEPIALDNCTITNRDLLEAFWHLAYYRESPSQPPRRVNYAALDVEELGSVYESLLEYHPQVDTSGTVPRFALAPGSERKSTGSYYTPPELVAELIRSALEPVIEERLKAARTSEEKERAILSIRVCDPAAGSGHFLLAAARRLGKELARIRTGEDEPAPEQVREAIRDVVAHCIYGVDKNPLAVELCRVALWLEAHCAGKPLTFLDHRIRCGDSLVGVFDLKVLEKGIPDEAFTPASGDDKTVANQLKKRNRSERRDLETGQLSMSFDFGSAVAELATEYAALENIPDDTPAHVKEKQRRFDSARCSPLALRQLQACNLWTAAFFQRMANSEWRMEKGITTQVVTDHLAGRSDPQAVAHAEALAAEHRFFHWPLEFPEVFAEGGFDVVLGNPPFMGGLKISGNFGDKYRRWLEVEYAPYGGTADLCAAFYRRVFGLLKPGGRMGMVATNTIGQGDTRESGLAVILRQGGVITFARRFIKWPGAANVEVNLVAIHKPHHSPLATRHSPILDGHPVPFISSRLDPEPEGEPKRLPQNEAKAFQGDIVRGIGFVLDPDEAKALLAKDPRNADCLFPYLNGEDLNSHPEQKPSRYVICFHDWSLERAKQYPDLLRIVEERVKPERERLRGPGDARNRQYWWQFGAYRAGMRRAIAHLRRVLVRAEVSQLHMVSFVPKDWVYSHMLIVFAFDDDYHFALLQSGVHEVWLRKQASSLRTDVRYTPTDCFDTFPFPPEEYERMANSEWRIEGMPEAFQRAAQVGAEYHEHRRQIMLARSRGLTKTYNLFHDPACTDGDIVRLREMHTEMDRAILACYGWEDVDLRHDFYQNDRGQMRYTVSPEARRELLRRLLDWNQKIAEENK
ncbi:Eco57I restriction-modification methylase domain-containing protein [Limisphaera sp. 4302-co]|uniref:Eco57I restriction-modification methylase domain-containing protein n=1 Tax=Limisphaera sp. 4302-co TaxID=3400417 RepID=UPI003C138431